MTLGDVDIGLTLRICQGKTLLLILLLLLLLVTLGGKWIVILAAKRVPFQLLVLHIKLICHVAAIMGHLLSQFCKSIAIHQLCGLVVL